MGKAQPVIEVTCPALFGDALQALDPLRRAKLVRVVGRDQRPRVALIRGAKDTSVKEVLDTIRGSELPAAKLHEMQQASSSNAECSLADVVTGKGQL